MKIIKVLLSIAAVLAAQTMLFNRVAWLQMIDLFLLLNLYMALNSNQLSAMAFSVPSGLVQDTFSQGIIGMNAFSKTIVVFLVSGLSSRLMLKHPLVIGLLIFLSTHLDFIVVLGLHRLFNLQTPAVSYWMIVLSSLLNSVIGAVAFQITDRIRTKKEYA